VKRPLIRITADDAASLVTAEEAVVRQALADEGLPRTSGPLVAMHFRGTTYDREVGLKETALMAAVADQIVQEASAHIYFVSMGLQKDGVDDRVAADAVVQQMRHPESATVLHQMYDPGTVKGLIRQSDLAIGTSYHFQVFALTAGIPTVGLYKGPYYRQKAHGLFGHFDLADATFDLESCSAEAVARRALGALSDRDALGKRLRSVTHQLDGALDEVWDTVWGWFSADGGARLARANPLGVGEPEVVGSSR
jgi:polysaccharide pyruvyl transferase WcaK-like protein